MTGFDLLTNYIDDPEALLKKTKAKIKKVSALELKDHHIRRSSGSTPTKIEMQHEITAPLPS